MKMQKSRLRPLTLRNALLSAAVALGLVACGHESTQAPTSTATPTPITRAFSDQAALGAGKFAANCAACPGVTLD